ncbi:PIN domain-containing protein [Quadrisphaera granulorum]|uniref:PIN domain-containing protein n=1 Tax=Quadrisphaera granulorum TaxID=317664 RepID=A0A315ZI09_9ACTN|nr:PIN domain-containing protein [Quadrisphaera granulorum]PWJ45156.1 PIN domain-containing protein [Quadrisphaera granulorum]SZE99191.1 PIN domain-containing protein [Quadrisphaera granulorum]
MFTGLLDTCVLWPSTQRDFLLSLAIEGMYRPVWSSAILAELEEHEAIKLVRAGLPQRVAAERAGRLIATMRSTFIDAETQGWEPLEGTFGLPDIDDEHVVAAAVIAGAGAIVTHNVKDFPTSQVPSTVQVLTPSVFAYNTVTLGPARAVRAIHAMASRSGRKGPIRTTGEVLDILEHRYAMTEAVAMLREVVNQGP